MREKNTQILTIVLCLALFCGCRTAEKETNVADISEEVSLATESIVKEETTCATDNTEETNEKGFDISRFDEIEDFSTIPNNIEEVITSPTEKKETEPTTYQQSEETVETRVPTPENNSNVTPDDEL